MEVEEESEQTLLVVREVSAYKIPPRSTSSGYRCAEWLQSDKIWSGRLRVISFSSGKCEIRLEDSSSGELFATCHVQPGSREASVESVSDSSRYFVLKIDDGRGRHAFIGLGFVERNDAFDFNVALSDHEKYARRSEQEDEQGQQQQQQPQQPLDLRLKDGETIKINVRTSRSTAAPAASSKTAARSIASTGGMKAPLAPPPGGGRIRSPLPPPNEPSKGANADATNMKDPLSDVSQLESALPAPNTNNRAAGWAAF